MPSVQLQPLKDRTQIALAGMGLISESFPRVTIQSAAAPASQEVQFCAVGLRAGDVVTNISVVCNAAGTSVTLVKVGLYKKDGTQLAVSAESSASFGSAGIKTIAMGTPYTVPADDVYFAAFLGVATTNPTIGRSSGGFGTASVAVGSGARAWAIQTTQADMPAPATFATGSVQYWFGIS